jgi:flagellar biosynthesis GTPase FlhF
MSSALNPAPFDIDAILAGAGGQLAELLRYQSGAEPLLAATFRADWRARSGLHADLLAACEPLFAALATLDPAQWAAAPAHDVWRVLALVQHSGVGYQPELGRAGEKILLELGSAAQLAASDGWAAATAALEGWWTQEQQRLGRLEQRLVDTERGQLRTRRAQQVAARLLNQNMAGRSFAREVVEYLQREWFQELQWALLQFGVDSEQWQRRAQLTERLVASLQPPGDDDEARQQLYALIPDVGAELAALLDERAHDRGILEQQLALIEAQHLLLLRGQEPPGADFQLIANNDPWLSTTTISASLLQRVTVLEPGSWFALRDGDGELRIKLALKLDDSTQLLFVNRLGVKALQKSFEEFAYLLSVGAAQQLPAPDCARAVLHDALAHIARSSIDDHQARAEARRLADIEARLRIEAKAKAMAEARALAAVQAQAEAQARADEEAARRAREEQDAEEERRQRELEQNAAELLRQEQLRQERAQREMAQLQAQRELAQQQLAQQQLAEQQERERAQQEQAQREEAARLQREAEQENAQPEIAAPAGNGVPVPDGATLPEQPARTPSPADEQRLRAARREAGLLPLGSWIELLDEAGNAQRLKVAVKLPSSGKLILVDRDGVRQAEFDRDTFASLLFEERARVLNQGPKFEDTLAKVVDSMRRDRAPRE